MAPFFTGFTRGIGGGGFGVMKINKSPYLPAYVNGTVTFTTNGTWTVPENIGYLKVTANGGISGANGGTVQCTFRVTPGETFRISNHSGGDGVPRGANTLSFGLDTGSALTQSTLWIIAGAGGGSGRRGQFSGSCPNDGLGGSGGGDTGVPGTGASYAGCYPSGGGGGSPSGGGTQSAGGSGSFMTAYPGEQAGSGSALQGGNASSLEPGTPAGGGGSGWYGGGGGTTSVPNGGNPSTSASGGGGGSSRIQIPSPRSAQILENSQGTWSSSSPGYSSPTYNSGRIFIEY
jgi:hypothetical protein